MMRKNVFAISVLALITFTGCNKDDNTTPPPSDKEPIMITLNEGQWTKGTASISATYKDGSTVFDIFQDVNKRPLGDVATHIIKINNYYFITLLNSGKVEVVDPITFESVATIDFKMAANPKFITPINDHEALISDNSRQLIIIDTKTFTYKPFVAVSVALDKMVTINNKIFAPKGYSSSIYVMDTNNISSDAMRKIDNSNGAQYYQTAKPIIDPQNKLWVLAKSSQKGYIYRINPETETIDYTYEFPFIQSTDTQNYVDGCITGLYSYNRVDTDNSRTKIYFLATTLKGENKRYIRVLCFDTAKKTISVYKDVNESLVIYGMGISPRGEVVMCDATDYATRGFVRIYSDNTPINKISVGVSPRMLYFPQKSWN